MHYDVRWTGPAQRDMARLPGRIAHVIMTYVDERLAHDPHRLSKPLRGDLAALRSARSGDYRVLFRIDDTAARLFIRRVDHRAHVYRP